MSCNGLYPVVPWLRKKNTPRLAASSAAMSSLNVEAGSGSVQLFAGGPRGTSEIQDNDCMGNRYNFKDLTDRRFNRLLVIRTAGRTKNGQVKWECQCDCGRFTIVSSTNLGRTTNSCGCLARDILASRTRIHGMTHTPEYKAYHRMIKRCYNSKDPKFYCYGARGITVCDRWRDSFVNFFADMGIKPSSKHSLGRINNDGNYEPTNCRWETSEQQANNKQKLRWITFDGKTQTLNQWARSVGLKRELLKYRLNIGWPIERALNQKPRIGNYVRTSR